MLDLALLALAGALAAAINAVAGGGTLVSFPVLMLLGVPPLAANATNSVALWPGGLASALGYLRLSRALRRPLQVLLAPTVLGGLLGAWLLLRSPERVFAVLVPLLLGVATLLLALQRRLRGLLARRSRRLSIPWLVLLQLLISLYGGYFGAGMGILMIAALGLALDEASLHEINALKAWLALLINLVASLFFLAHGLIVVRAGLAVMAGSIVGGYVAARLAQRVDGERLRPAIVAVGLLMTLRFAWSAWKIYN